MILRLIFLFGQDVKVRNVVNTGFQISENSPLCSSRGGKIIADKFTLNSLYSD